MVLLYVLITERSLPTQWQILTQLLCYTDSLKGGNNSVETWVGNQEHLLLISILKLNSGETLITLSSLSEPQFFTSKNWANNSDFWELSDN